MKTRSLARRLAAVVAVATAVLASSASGQLPVALDAQVVPIAPPVAEATYPAHDYGRDGVPSADDRAGTTTWRVVQATGNCCENYVTTSAGGRLLDFGGTYVNYSDDRGVTWKRVTPLTPLVNGEGPFTIDGETVEYVSFLKGGWPSKELWYWSTDGLNYTQVSSKIVDKTLSGAAAQTLATTVRADADWNQSNSNTGMTTLGDRALLAAPDYPSGSSAWSVFDGAAFEWTPVKLADGTTP